VGVEVWTIEGRLNSLEKIGIMAWQRIKWSIEPPKDFTRSNFFNVAMVQGSNLV